MIGLERYWTQNKLATFCEILKKNYTPHNEAFSDIINTTFIFGQKIKCVPSSFVCDIIPRTPVVMPVVLKHIHQF